jgi:hypothetical protein
MVEKGGRLHRRWYLPLRSSSRFLEREKQRSDEREHCEHRRNDRPIRCKARFRTHYNLPYSQDFSNQTLPRCQRQLGIRSLTTGFGSA